MFNVKNKKKKKDLQRLLEFVFKKIINNNNNNDETTNDLYPSLRKSSVYNGRKESGKLDDRNRNKGAVENKKRSRDERATRWVKGFIFFLNTLFQSLNLLRGPDVN